jgi:hypothetical protein
LIKEQLSAGNNWVVFDDGAPIIGSHHLDFFKNKYDAAEFIHENATDRDYFCDMSIRNFAIQLEKWKKLSANPVDLFRFLETKMKDADWHYKEADHYERFCKGEKEIAQINYLLLSVIREQGLEKATALWKAHVPNHSSKPNFLNKKNILMTEQEIMHAKKQYGKIGIADGFDESLTARMRNGEMEIQHHYEKKFTITAGKGEDKKVVHQDEAKAVLHWKKLNDSNLYFLNKWDLTVKPDGKDKEVKMTFYVNDLKRMAHVIKNPNQFLKSFTFKSSVNYLCGRPVLNTYTNQNEKQFKAWDQAYPDHMLPNGKMKERTFHENYGPGCDLQKVASNYNMADLANTEYANRLYQSLERGNLQLENFVGKDGRQESLFITPNIQVGCLDVFTIDKEPVSLKSQVEKGYITEEFAQKVQERLNQIEREKNNITQGRGNVKSAMQNVADPAFQITQERVAQQNRTEVSDQTNNQIVAQPKDGTVTNQKRNNHKNKDQKENISTIKKRKPRLK